MPSLSASCGWKSLAGLVLVSAVVLFTNLGAPSLWDIDEPRNAVCAREMFERGDWVVPTFNGELRAHKPALLYWLMIGAYHVLGVNEFAARFWSALLGIGTVLITADLGRRLFNPRVGLWAGFILVTCLNFDIVARAATPDSVFLFCVTASLLAFVCAALHRDAADPEIRVWQLPSWRGFIGVYAVMGLAVLAKGPVGMVLPMAILGMFLLVDRANLAIAQEPQETFMARVKQTAKWLLAVFSWRNFFSTLWAMRPLTAIATVAAIAAPWYVAVAMRTDGAWVNEFFFKHNVSRFLEPMENHRGPIVYYLVAMCVGFFPWSLFIAPCLIRARRCIRERDATWQGMMFLACWAGVYVGFFSLAGTKLPNYVLPAYPALALMTAGLVDSMLGNRKSVDLRWLPRICKTLVAVGIVIGLALPLVANRYLPGDMGIGFLGLIPIIGGLVALACVRNKQTDRGIYTFAAAAVLFVTATFGWVLMRVDRHQHTAELVRWIQQSGGNQAEIAGFEYFRPSWVFYAGHSVGDLRAADEVAKFMQGSEKAFVITTDRSYEKLKSTLPAYVIPVTERKQFLKSGSLVVLGRGTPTASQTSPAARKPL